MESGCSPTDSLFLTLVQTEVSDQFHAPAALPSGRQPAVPIVWDWVDPRADVDVLEKRRKIFIF
jgi:hypothetical protein